MITKWLVIDVAIGLLVVAGAIYLALSLKPDRDRKSERFFNRAIAYLMTVEGGYIHHPKDPGGETNFGISKKAFPKLDIKNLSQAKAKQIYQKMYWQPCFHPAMGYKIAVITFDGCVHLGVREGIKQLQKAMRLPADGVLGAGTVGGLRRISQKDLAVRMLTLREESYRKLPQYKTFRKAWLNRLFQLAFNAEEHTATFASNPP